MSDRHTPTVEKVRAAYNYMGGSGPDSDAGLDAEFDRFLARVKAEAWAEGAYAGYDDCKHDGDTPNPYIPDDQ